MKKILSGAVAGAVLLFSIPLHAESDSVVVDELRQCREYVDVEKRLACYDRIGEPDSVVETTAVAAKVDPPEAADAGAEVPREVDGDSSYRELTDDIGLPKSEDDYEAILTTVVRCGEANDRRFYFYLDNGQVWKYIGGRKLRYRNCDTKARLIEDGLGFKLQLDGESRQSRVLRVR